ncbi:MAG: hypothetical protein QME92_03405 [Bacillota bacterium]|nr:hypothetical protein [Bacillota bacterium]
MTWHGVWAGDCAADPEKGRGEGRGDGNSREAAPRRVFCDETGVLTIDARGLTYRELNHVLRAHVRDGARAIAVRNVAGQRYIGTNLGRLRYPVTVEIHGTPGSDLGAFMDGPRLTVFGNAQDCVGNTMTSGEIVVHGRAGDVVAMSMRGGAIFIRDDVGSRCAIHMKEYGDRKPLVVIGGTAHDFLGEYMAGGTVIMLGLDLAPGERHRACFVGTGMHGGRIFIRGSIEAYQVGREVELAEPDSRDQETIMSAVERFCTFFGTDFDKIANSEFLRLHARSHRPYGRLYGA